MSPLRCLFLALLLVGPGAAGPLVVGHRGAGADDAENPYPENTLPSVRSAFAAGAHLVEVDVQLSADGIPVLWHDDAVDLGGRELPVSALTWDQLPDAVSGQGLRAPVPRLADVLREALRQGRGRRVLDIELKVVEEERRDQLVDAVAEVLRRQRAAHRVLVTSFDVEALAHLERDLPGIETGLLGVFRGATLRTARGMVQTGTPVEWVIPSRFSSPFVGEGFVEEAHEEGFLVGTWTVNSPSRIRRRIEAGYDMIITDTPGQARGLLEQLAAPGQGAGGSRCEAGPQRGGACHPRALP